MGLISLAAARKAVKQMCGRASQSNWLVVTAGSPNLSPVVSVIQSHGSWKLGSSVWNVSARVHATLNLRAPVLSQYTARVTGLT